MSKVTVIYAGNDDVGKVIRNLGGKKRRNVKKGIEELAPRFVQSSSEVASTVPLKKEQSAKKVNDKQHSNAPVNILSIAGSVDFLKDDSDINVPQVYTFKTPKKLKQMTKFAAESARKNRLKNLGENHISLNAKNEKERNKESATLESKRVTRSLVNGKTQLSESESGSDDDTDAGQSESDDDSSRCIIDKTARMKSDGCAALPSKRLQLPSARELYFTSQHGEGKHGERQSAKTSDRTLQQLRNPKMAPEHMAEILKRHRSERQKDDDVEAVNQSQLQLIESYKLHFTKWMFYICNNFNILLFGLGSKRKLIHSFCDEMLMKHQKLIINGFFPSLSIKSILTTIREDVLNLTTPAVNIEAQFEEIRTHYDVTDTSIGHLFLIIHNIDGAMLRNPLAQSILCRLSELPKIHIIASIDHINAPLIWDQTRISRFRWLWHDVTTYTSYTEETSYEGSLMLTGGGSGIGAHGSALALSGLLHVSRSLTSNARGVFRIILERHLADNEGAGDSSASEDFSFSDLYQRCRERFLVNSELTLRAHLTEFVDHKLVHIRKGADGGEYLSVPLDAATLKEYLEHDDAS